VFVVDASVWVSRLVRGDIHHEPSRLWLGRLAEQGTIAVAPALLLAEVAGAIARRTGRSALALRAVSLLQALPNLRLVPIDAELAGLAARLAAELHLRGADALYVSLAQRLGMRLVTWDNEQRERGRKAVSVLSPQELLSIL